MNTPPEDTKIGITSDITNGCNSRCTICYLTYRTTSEPAAFMAPDQFRIICGKLRPYSGTLSLSCAFEPLIHPQADEIITLASGLEGFAVRINTNAITMREPVRLAMMQGSIASVIVSLDAASPELYEAIRGSKRFNSVLENTRLLTELRRTLGRTTPQITLRMTLLKTNLPELSALVRLAAELQVDKLVVQLMAPTKGARVLGIPSDELVIQTQENAVQEAFVQARKLATELGLPLELPRVVAERMGGAQIWDGKKRPVARAEVLHIPSNGLCRANVYNTDIHGKPITENCGDIFTDSLERLLDASRRLSGIAEAVVAG